jgi:hypothetical protein
MTDEFKWWEHCQFPPLSKGAPQFYWANQALIQAAIKLGGPANQHSEVSGTAVKSITDLIQAYQDLGGRIVKHNRPGPHETEGTTVLMVWPLGAVEISGTDHDVDVWWASIDPELYEKMRTIAAAGVKEKTSGGRVYVVVQGEHGPRLESVGLAGIPIIEDNYIPGVVEDFEHVVEDLQKDPPCGRIIIFDGEPGTGKTFLVRALLNAVENAMFVMIPAAMVQELAGPNLVGALIRNHEDEIATILIVEDADECLVKRDGGNMGSISSLLNLSDGILGATLNIRIIATTNAGHLKSDEALDEAIMRPGRLCRRINVPPLPRKQAEAVYKRLTGKDRTFPDEMTVAEVYRAARDEGWQPKKTQKTIGFRNRVSQEPDIDY